MRLHHRVLHEAVYFFFQLLTPPHYIKIAGMERSLCSLEHRDCNSSQSCCSPCRKEAFSLSAPALPPTQGPAASSPRGFVSPMGAGKAPQLWDPHMGQWHGALPTFLPITSWLPWEGSPAKWAGRGLQHILDSSLVQPSPKAQCKAQNQAGSALFCSQPPRH